MTERAVELVPELIRGQGRDGRCKHDPSTKAELMRRCLQPGVSVGAMALAHGVNANLVRWWIVMSAASNR
jgi:transposase